MSQATLGSGPYRNSNLFSGYYLDERVADLDAWDCDEEAADAFERIRSLWDKEGALLPSYNEDELIDTWIAEILDILGYGTSTEVTLPDGGGYVDRLLFENDAVRREGAKRALDGDHEGLFSRGSAILEAKQWDADFEQRFAEQRSYRDASHQIKYYLERTPSDLKWGVLTDGKKWRLYGTKDYETQTYYEVDLPEILENGNLEAFKYFYVFFRPEAFVEHAESSFLDDVWTESETAAQELGEDLQDNVFRALRVLGKGFVESNDLDVGPDGEVDRDELKQQSLVLLYRLMFVLYAESRGLIDPDDLSASEEYHEYFSLEAKREEILDDVEGMGVESGEAFTEEYSRFSTSIWGRLSELFELIDEGEESLDIPPYNGGLFSREDHAFLTEYEVKDPYIAEVIYWLSTTEDEEGEHVPADYADLDTRHLGSIYEGLLEHEFRIADAEGVAAVAADGGQVWKPASEVTAAEAIEIVEEGGLYVVNDEGERKATGAYYTPDYVVTYIVEETVDPLIDEIDEDLREQGLNPSDREYFAEFWQEVKDLTILDPAMGSGHFLTKATGYLTEQVMEVVREQEIQSYDEQDIRRTISKEVIYGVDINEMAVELSKLSMWLETLAADQPLAFLDHHLKTGNSLVGSDVTEVLSEDGGDDDGGQLTLTQALARVRRDTLGHVMDLMTDLLAYDNETLADVKSMEELYDEIRDDPLYTRLFELANVHTAEEFGVDVPDGSYEQMAGAIEDEDDWAEIRGEDWFTAAQATADEQDFFHWELEFPEVFFGSDGEKLENAGFDSVVGNPPYVRMEQIKPLKPYLSTEYSVHGERVDLYGYFIEKSLRLTDGMYGAIVSNKWMRSEYGEGIRELLSEMTIRSILDFGDLEVFSGVSTYPSILIVDPETRTEGEVHVSKFDDLDFSDLRVRSQEIGYNSSLASFDGGKWSLVTAGQHALMKTIENSSTQLKNTSLIGATDVGDNIGRGLVTGGNEAFVISEETKNTLIEQDPKSAEIIKPLLKGTDISRYRIVNEGRYLIYAKHGINIDDYPAIRDHLEQFRNEIGNTATNEEWYELQQPQEEYENLFESEKICYPDIAKECSFAMDSKGYYLANTCYFIPSESHVLLGILNSAALNWYYGFVTSEYRGGYQRSFTHAIKTLPIPSGTDEQYEKISEHVEKMIRLKDSISKLNLSLIDHLGMYDPKRPIAEFGFFQPPTGASESTLSDTASQKSNLRVGTARVDRESPNTVLIKATARYKPDDEDAHDTDRWGYTETEYLPAFRITDLAEREADLIEHFVPVAVDEAGGFANFRENATKTNSLIDRLKTIELPDIDDVADDLENYLRTKERAEELDAKIEQTDALIDEIVYESYGLTDEEIEIVEEAVGK